MSSDNVCFRCGKTRVLVKTWVETVDTISGTTELTYTQYACPDEECQQQVNADLEEKRVATVKREKAAKEREAARLESRARALKHAVKTK